LAFLVIPLLSPLNSYQPRLQALEILWLFLEHKISAARPFDGFSRHLACLGARWKAQQTFRKCMGKVKSLMPKKLRVIGFLSIL